ncbi:unnamed protein product [Hymenolepis diminuta]|uniref:non-specific protein-tyrosine kinase n=1 Tax=Hymenolepis diminuta TaxID=6216 RepID=A0A0R3SL10_HYMDI|nr:unnamed protein product [Hymenolepis diminuta]
MWIGDLDKDKRMAGTSMKLSDERLRPKYIELKEDQKEIRIGLLNSTSPPNPAVKRILANVDKFAVHCPKKKKYPPLKDFLEVLQLTDIQEELEDKLKISRVEHLRYATVEDLQTVVGRENAKSILESCKATNEVQVLGKGHSQNFEEDIRMDKLL